jgi:mRNA-degrading endonuclease toxin of MazEF toxin-antitoxin module
MKRGSIHWANTEKRRPLLIVSPDRRNLFAHDVLVIPCSTSARRMGWHVGLERGEGGLPRACHALCEQVALLDKEFIDAAALGVLSEGRMREIKTALMSALGIDD